MNLTGGEEPEEMAEDGGGDPTPSRVMSETTQSGSLLLESVPEDPDEETEAQEDEEHDERVESTPRLPRQDTRARLVRTPARKDRESPTEQPADIADDQLLITELKDSEYEAVDESEKAEKDENDREVSDKEYDEEEIKRVTIETVDVEPNPDEEWDTDLEEEEEPIDRDVTGRSHYQKICRQMGVVPISYFVRHIQDHEITMKYHGLGPAAAKAIALVLRDNVTLEKLNLEGNYIEADGGQAVARMLEENDYVTELGLAENKLKSQGAMFISKMLGINAGLRKIDLSANEFDDADAETFAELLDNAKYLREINLSRNKFGRKAGEILGPAIGANDILDSMDLSWNHLRCKGAIAVAKGIKENVRLKVCRMGWNGFGPEGGEAIAEAIATNSSLVELDISGNRLNGHVAVKIAKALASNESLHILRMGNNLITTVGAIALLTAINTKDDTELEELDLTDIPVEFEFLRILEDIKLKKPDFKVTHGPVLRSGNTGDDLIKPAIDPYRTVEPVLILKEHIVINDARLLDILKRYDTDESLSVTPEVFLQALEELAVPYDRARMEDAVFKLATDQSGKIYFGDFVKQQQDSLEAMQT